MELVRRELGLSMELGKGIRAGELKFGVLQEKYGSEGDPLGRKYIQCSGGQHLEVRKRKKERAKLIEKQQLVRWEITWVFKDILRKKSFEL